jgi:hypothetical protein
MMWGWQKKALRETYDTHQEHIGCQRNLRRRRRAIGTRLLKENGARIRARIEGHRRAALEAKLSDNDERCYHLLRGVCDDTHAYVFALATRCNGRITGNYSQNYVDGLTLYGVKGWYFVKRTYLRRQGLGGV